MLLLALGLAHAGSLGGHRAWGWGSGVRVAGAIETVSEPGGVSTFTQGWRASIGAPRASFTLGAGGASAWTDDGWGRTAGTLIELEAAWVVGRADRAPSRLVAVVGIKPWADRLAAWTTASYLSRADAWTALGYAIETDLGGTFDGGGRAMLGLGYARSRDAGPILAYAGLVAHADVHAGSRVTFLAEAEAQVDYAAVALRPVARVVALAGEPFGLSLQVGVNLPLYGYAPSGETTLFGSFQPIARADAWYF
jgi:hypothetical protein